ncbi:uncharacterized protein NFIA_005000 [Aspergillus fischeri NRRL 181]|uniref:MACPF domain-containing protein n=1 Tax=Neosartorya fischeri (strain ATCC 1020 / DSM 3700 / CBS 544.65 / FGSC A1164 / JCM 1740 / NRRL 181 / WB 181) TaxID=331117 RepID=A1DKA1_NEOFI|nr:uncharacterized protein NFIA_005000 [Aspergillus fischeri NRRL 181]EAW17140.1 hypothetical protein NFIA_005000 [Aspergillus fischeri NRRL 181]KAG2001256.1 hypothetical protein GB937_010325 [Aspergillus fischeri]
MSLLILIGVFETYPVQSDPRDLPKNELSRVKPEFKPDDWKATAGKAPVINPADMDEKHWGIVMRNNGVLCGLHPQGEIAKEITLPSGKTVTIPLITVPTPARKAYCPAFAIKPRAIAPHDITFEDKDKEKVSDDKTKLFCIPRFRITDKTSVEVFETRNSLEKSLAESGFTQHSVKGGVGGTIGPVSGGFSGGYNSRTDNINADAFSVERKYMHISFNFYKQFGELFEPEVHLGGRLFSTEEFDGVVGSTVGQKITNLKIAAGASFSGGGFSAKVSGKYEEANNKKEDIKSATMTQSISWCADGGDTTLCNNAPAWCPTVASFYNWRVMQKTKLVKLVDHIGLLPTYNDIPCLTRNIECLAAAEKDCLSFSSENFVNFAPVPSPEYCVSDVSFKIPIAEPSTLFYDKEDEKTKIKV